jgi:hypothetical protein
MKITLSELKQIIRNLIKEPAEKRLDQSPEYIQNIIQLYIEESIYDIQNSKGNCAFFAIDFYDWFKGINEYANIKSQESIDLTSKNKIKILYMPQDVPTANQFISAEIQKEVEDHIVVMINNNIIDFVFEPGQGVSKDINRDINLSQTNPVVIKYSSALFDPTGLYGQYGYIDKNVEVEENWITGNKITSEIPPFVRSNTITKPTKKFN